MTDSKTYDVRGAQVTVTASIYPQTIDVSITVDTSPLDVDLPNHSPHNLISYLDLPRYTTRDNYWWAKVHRKVTCKTGSQAQRIIKHALTQIDDAVYQALLARSTRMAEINSILV